MKVYAFAVCLAMWLTTSCFGGTLFDGPESAIWLEPVTYTGRMIARMGDVSVANPSWHISQWENPSPMQGASSDYAAQPGTSWSFGSSPSTNVKFYALPDASHGVAENTLELAQNGTTTPCGNEFDLLAGSISPGSYSDPSGNPIFGRMATSAPLNQLSSVLFQVNIAITYESIAQRCSVNFAAYGFNLIAISTQGYSMFFQVIVRDSRGVTPSNSPCVGYPNGKSYCFTSTANAINPNVGSQGVSNTRTSYNLNVYNQLTKAVQSTPDKNLADWSITSTYLGQHVNGSAIATSQWDSFKLVAY